MKRIQVPEGMLKACEQAFQALDRWHSPNGDTWIDPKLAACIALESALLWLSENPIQPTPQQFAKLYEDTYGDVQRICEWQRRMFLAPEPEIPEELKDLMWGEGHPETRYHLTTQYLNQTLLTAYLRGKASR